MASEWSMVSVSDIASPEPGGIAIGPFGSRMKSDCYVADGVRVVRGNNLTGGRTFSEEFVFVTSEKAKSLGSSLLKPNDLVFPHRGSIGEVGIVPRDGHSYVMSTSLMKLTCDVSKVIPDYVYYFFKSETGRHALLANKSQVGTPGIGQPLTSLKSIRFAIPPMSEQRAITSIMAALDDRIESLRLSSVTTECIARAIFKSWFVDFDPVRAKAERREPEGMDAAMAALFPSEFQKSALGLIPKGWSQTSLGSISQKITKGTTPTTLKRAFVDSGVNFIKAESISDEGFLLPDKFAFIDSSTNELLRRSQIEQSDVLVTIAGTIGRVAEASSDHLPANTNQAVAIIRPNIDISPGCFIRRYLRLPETQQRLRERTVEAVQANVSLATLAAVQMVLPPPEVLRSLCSLILEPLDQRVGENMRLGRTLTEFRDTLLPRLISGRLRVPEAEKLMEAAL